MKLPNPQSSTTLGNGCAAKCIALCRTGLLLRLEDGTHAFIRRRELSWSSQSPDLHAFAKNGDLLDAVVLQRDAESGNLSLSLRLLEHDPWRNVSDRYSEGSQVAGTVVQVAPFGAFVEIEPGLKGLIPLSEIDPEKDAVSIDESLWVGDRVQSLVANVDPAKRHITLSIRALFLRERVQKSIASRTSHPNVAPLADLVNSDVAAYLRQLTTHSPPPAVFTDDLPQPNRIRRILIIDDHPGFREPTADWLESNGYIVARAETGEQGVELVRQSLFDFILLDMHLPGGNGIEIAQQILDLHPDTPLALASAFEISDDQLSQIEQMGVPLFFKPLDVAEISELLRAIEKTGALPSVTRQSQLQDTSSKLVWHSAQALRVRQSLRNTLEKILAQIERETRSDFTAVFQVPLEDQVQILAGTHLPPLAQSIQLRLQYSPLQDVVRDQHPLMENDVNAARRRFRHLLAWTVFGSCIGVSIPLLSGKSEFVFFLFHSKSQHFSQTDQEHAMAIAPLLGAAIARQQVEEYLQESQKLMLVGQLGSGVLHEVFNRLGGAPLTLRSLSKDLAKLAPAESGSASAVSRIQEAVSRLNNNLNAIFDAIKLFRQVSRAEDYEMVNINASLHRAVDLLRPIAQKNNVEIESHLDPFLPQTRSIGVRLDQIFLNVLLNAIQWTAFRPVAKVVISTTYRKESELPIQIHFQDNGPGIHWQNYDKVYDLGFTTKKEGTGVGLFLAQGLVESVGGRIRIEDSIMFLGTTFFIELPFRSQEEKT